VDTPDCGAGGSGFESGTGKIVNVCFVCFVVVVVLLFVQKSLFAMKFCNSFRSFSSCSILNMLQNVWPIIRVSRYRPSILKHVPKTFYSKCLLRLVVLRVPCCAKCLFLYGPFCYGALKYDHIYIVNNIFFY